jgi:hypothetical protein
MLARTREDIASSLERAEAAQLRALLAVEDGTKRDWELIAYNWRRIAYYLELVAKLSAFVEWRTRRLELRNDLDAVA